MRELSGIHLYHLGKYPRYPTDSLYPRFKSVLGGFGAEGALAPSTGKFLSQLQLLRCSYSGVSRFLVNSTPASVSASASCSFINLSWECWG